MALKDLNKTNATPRGNGNGGNNGGNGNGNGRGNNNGDNGGDRRRTWGDDNNGRAERKSIVDATASIFSTDAVASVALTALEKYVKGLVSALPKIDDIKVETFMVTEDVVIPALVIGLVRKVEDQTFVIGQGIMVVDNSNPPETLYRDSDRHTGEEVQHLTIWADYWDKDFVDAVGAAIEVEYPNHIFINGGCSAVDESLLPVEKLMGNDVNYRSMFVERLFKSILIALDALRATEEQERSRDVSPDNLSNGAILVGEVSLQATTATQPTGNPVAEDFSIRIKESFGRSFQSTRGQVRQPNRKTVNDLNEMGTVSGRIEFTYVGVDEDIDTRRPRLEDSAVWGTQFIITDFDAVKATPTLPLLLLMAHSTGHLAVNNHWAEAFLPRNTVGQTSRNLGALAVELEDPETGKPSDRALFPQTTDDQVFNNFIRAAILDMSRIGLEVPTHGPMVAMLQILELAAREAMDRGDSRNNDMLLDAADVLTGGELTKLFNGDVMSPFVHVFPVGTWYDNNQEPRDSREVNSLYLYNLENPADARAAGRRYDDAMKECNDLVAGQAVINELRDIHGNLIQTDNVRRVYFNPDFMNALNTALLRSNMAVTLQNRGRGRTESRRRLDTHNFMRNSDVKAGYRSFGGNNGGSNWGGGNNGWGNARW